MKLEPNAMARHARYFRLGALGMIGVMLLGLQLYAGMTRNDGDAESQSASLGAKPAELAAGRTAR